MLRFFLVITLSIFLSFKGVLPFIASTSMLSSANAAAAEQDAVMICTGASYRWVSLAKFYATGELVDVEHEQLQPHHLTCPLGAFDLYSDDDDTLISSFLPLTLSQSQTSYIDFYQSALIALVRGIHTRGPPLSFI